MAVRARAEPAIAGPAALLRLRGIGVSAIFQLLVGGGRRTAGADPLCALDAAAGSPAILDNWALAAALGASSPETRSAPLVGPPSKA